MQLLKHPLLRSIFHTKHLIPFGFFSLFFVLGWSVLPDYGVSWDEFLQRRYGQLAYDHVVRTLGLDWSLFFPDYQMESAAGRQYPVIFSLTAAALEQLFQMDPEDLHAQFRLRHRMIFVLFWLATIGFYKILQERFSLLNPPEKAGAYLYPLLGTLLFILTPRIFAHAFFNPKDIVLLSFYIISLYTLLRFLKNPSVINGLFHGLTCALVVNVRTPGLIVPALTLGFTLLHILNELFKGDKKSWKPFLGGIGIFGISFTVFGIAFFPYLWNEFSARATESFQLMSQFPKDMGTLVFGQFVKTTPPPFYYPYAWMGITLPLLNLFLILTGIFRLLKNTFKNLQGLQLWNGPGQFYDLIFAAFFLGPLLAVWFFQSTLYDGWRHLYFIYPPALLLGLVPLLQVLMKGKGTIRIIMLIVICLSCLHTTYRMIRLHPHQQVYFNELAGANKMERFEMDYWGVAYKQAFEEIVRRDTTGEPIHVHCANQPCFDNYFALPEPTKSKIRMRYGIEVATYYLSNFRWEHELEKFCNGEYPFQEEYFSIMADGERIIGVYKVK